MPVSIVIHYTLVGFFNGFLLAYLWLPGAFTRAMEVKEPSAVKAPAGNPEAITLYEQILPEMERVLGADHPETLATRNNLAVAYREREAGRTPEKIEPQASDP